MSLPEETSLSLIKLEDPIVEISGYLLAKVIAKFQQKTEVVDKIHVHEKSLHPYEMITGDRHKIPIDVLPNTLDDRLAKTGVSFAYLLQKIRQKIHRQIVFINDIYKSLVAAMEIMHEL